MKIEMAAVPKPKGNSIKNTADDTGIVKMIAEYIKTRQEKRCDSRLLHNLFQAVSPLHEQPTIRFAKELKYVLSRYNNNNRKLIHLYGVLSEHRNWYLLKDRADCVHSPYKRGLLFHTIVKFILTSDTEGKVFESFLKIKNQALDVRFFSGTYSTAIGSELEEPIKETMKYFFSSGCDKKYKIEEQLIDGYWCKNLNIKKPSKTQNDKASAFSMYR